MEQIQKMSDKEQEFWGFHYRNPEVYELLRDIGVLWRAKDRNRRGSIRMLWETARWKAGIDYTHRDVKLPDSHMPFYARLLHDSEPKLQGMFKFHKQKQRATIGPK